MALTMAWEEAHRFNHNYVGTEHLLLGLFRVSDEFALQVLSSLGIEPSKVKSAVEFMLTRGSHTMLENTTFSNRAKKILEMAADEARKSGRAHVGTEHLLLGILREGEGIAAGVLESLGVSQDRVKNAIR